MFMLFTNRNVLTFIFLFIFLLPLTFAHSQNLYDTDLLSTDFHVNKRSELRLIMPDSSVAVIFANSIHNKSNDINFEFHQNPNFYYLTGLKEPNAMLLIFKDSIEINGFMQMFIYQH